MHRITHRTSQLPRNVNSAMCFWIGCAVVLGLLTPATGAADDDDSFRRAQATIRVAARVVRLSGGGASDEAVAMLEKLHKLAIQEDLEALDAATSEAEEGQYLENGLIRLSLIAPADDAGIVASQALSGLTGSAATGSRQSARQILIEFVGS